MNDTVTLPAATRPAAARPHQSWNRINVIRWLRKMHSTLR